MLSHIHYFHGPGFDLFAAPAGSRLGFLLVADPVTGAARLGEVQRAILAAVPGLEVLVGSSALEGQPASAEMQRSAAQPDAPGGGLEYRAAEMDDLRKPDPPPAGPAVMSEIDLDELFQAPEPPPPVEVEDLPSLEDLFGEAAEKAAAMDADAFWEEIASDNPDPSLNPHAISYDEAREIGLSPDEN